MFYRFSPTFSSRSYHFAFKFNLMIPFELNVKSVRFCCYCFAYRCPIVPELVGGNSIFPPLISLTFSLRWIYWVTLVNKIIQVSGVQFDNTSSAHCVVCSPPQVKSPSVTIYPIFRQWNWIKSNLDNKGNYK